MAGWIWRLYHATEDGRLFNYPVQLSSRYDALRKRMPIHREGLRDRLRGELSGSHPRTPDAAAALISGLTTLEAYAKGVGALDEKSGEEFLARASAGVVEAA